MNSITYGTICNLHNFIQKFKETNSKCSQKIANIHQPDEITNKKLRKNNKSPAMQTETRNSDAPSYTSDP